MMKAQAMRDSSIRSEPRASSPRSRPSTFAATSYRVGHDQQQVAVLDARALPRIASSSPSPRLRANDERTSSRRKRRPGQAARAQRLRQLGQLVDLAPGEARPRPGARDGRARTPPRSTRRGRR